MSELINNREHTAQELTERQRTLKEIIKELHAGKSVEEVKARFAEAVGGVSVAEISAMEHALMTEEGIPVSEVQRLCSVHTSIFKGSIEDIHRPSGPEEQPGHPVHTFKLENREIERLVNFKLALHAEQFQKDDSPKVIYKLLEDLSLLMDVDKHYSRKENLVFPYLERYGIFGPTKVMWGVDDGIRAAIKDAKKLLTEYNGDRDQIGKALAHIMSEVNEMIFKEENILLPMALSKLTEDEWLKIARESEEIGFCLTAPEREWIPERAEEPVEALEQTEDTSTSGTPQGFIRFETGIVSVQQLELLLNHLPVDLTFIDENDVVRYFSHGKERIFARTKAVIGRTVQNCHPPQSVHVVEKLLEDFKAGRKDVEDFWIPIKDKFVYIRYFAVRDSEGRYLGTLEFTQNIAPIRALEGQKRILSE
ncbi:DUF438 domain-containing protein [Paenibacillus polymyxa]|uniref:Uncharacterized conserved protein n=1 Tax=Paenibacillus polymyxa TaxID=1406 RepID=A0A0F0FYR7_PAEPO|nr:MULTISPECIES: DUF438 domain-containing protein [Paenibacillus]AHM64276.1 hypothetical protein PPSQR21_006130 [Paenibacillus polymyxa SQR-21]AIY09952.1 hypothetical protein LK13_15995 [Paenibacillus polymyxa]AUS24824.1 hypothetical protein C1A50_0633 [Paenibacillus polymyxa]KAF6653909.1 DUF438 domain-containing protein [Paenibacillus sp. EKM301P]KJK28979.1 hypothetical protein TY89_19770 [Paenibacillus polymyxa]